MAGKTKNVIAKRPRKAGLERRRRMKTHQKRLLAMGVPESKLKHMTAVDMRLELKKLRPKFQKNLG